MAGRHFTQEEAERLLPRLTALLEQMRELKQAHDRVQGEIAELAAKMRSNGHVLEMQLREAQQHQEEAAASVNGLIEEAQSLGCEIKGIDEGLVDFRSLKDGREVYLCWKLGEQRIAWWHELDTGFAGRQPLEE